MMAKMATPEMTGMVQRMMKNMDPDALSSMMRLSGMDVSPDQARKMKEQARVLLADVHTKPFFRGTLTWYGEGKG